MAVLLVALGHAGVGFLKGGFVGVDVFFVLSGFLITGLLLAGAAKQGHVSLREFYARRAKRILPAAALTLVVTDFAAYHLLNFVRAKQAVLDSIWAAFFSANVQFAHRGVDYFSRGQPPSPVQHYWSLAVEEQFYLVWPLVLALVLAGIVVHRRSRRGAGRHRRSAVSPGDPRSTPRTNTRRLALVIVLASLASLAWSIYDTNRSPVGAYFSTLARAWELGLGAALAIGATRFLRLADGARALLGWAGMLAIGLAAMLFSPTTAFPGSAALLPTVGTALVIAAGIGNERSPRGVGRLLGRSPMRYVGDRSYGFYLWHWPVLTIAAYSVGHALSLRVNLVLVGGAFALSIVSYALIENPIRHATLRRPIRTSAVLWGTSVLLVVVVAAVNLRSISAETTSTETLATGPVPTLAPPSSTSGPTGAALSPIPAVIAAVQAARQGAPIPSSLTPHLDQLLGDRYDPPTRGCYAVRGAPGGHICPLLSGSRTMVVFGDSHAREWMPAILLAASQDGWRVVPLIELGCGPSRYAGVCNSYLMWAVQQVRTLHPDAVLIGGQLMSGTPEVKQASVAGVSTLISAVTPFTKNVVLIGDPPDQGQQPVDCLLAHDATLGTCTRTLSGDQISVYKQAARAAHDRGAAFIDTIHWFCFQGRCPMVIAGTVTYRDNDHISKTYALELREVFRQTFAGVVFG